MRSTVLFVVFLSLWIKNYSQPVRETEVSSQVKKVKLYLNSALETRSGTASLDAGTHDVIFVNLPSSLVEESVRATGTGRATILSVSSRREFLKEKMSDPEIRLLEDSIHILESSIALKTALRDVYGHTRSMILANRDVRGKNTGLEPEDVMELADMYREKLKDLDEKIITNEMLLKKDNDRMDKLRKQFKETTGENQRPQTEVVVRVRVENRTEITFNLEYLTLDAGWEPLYDIRTEGPGTPLLFQFKASVWQNTGTPWKNVDITLSTGNPLESIDKPEIRSLLLSFYNPVTYKSRAKKMEEKTNYYYQNNAAGGIVNSDAKESTATARQYEVENLKQQIDAQSTYQWTQNKDMRIDTDLETEEENPYQVIRVNQVKGYFDSDAGISTDFLVTTPYSIPADGRVYMVDVHEKSIAASYRYYAVPAKEPHAFLVARVAGWDELNLVEANASIFNQGTFIGRIEINPNTTDDTLEVSLGRDKNIAVQRTAVPSGTSRNATSSTIKENFAWEIKVMNNKSNTVELVLTDNIPVSSNKEVVVELSEKSDADHDKEKGLLKWRLQLEPEARKNLQVVYSVKYPKTMIISNL